MTSAAMRRSQRVRFETPLTITSLDPQESFIERCKTLVVNAQGCGVVSSRAMTAGTLVRVDVPATQRGASGRILNCTPLGSRGDAYGVGIELDAPGNIWGLENPPADWQVTPYDTRAAVSAGAAKTAPSPAAPSPAAPPPPVVRPQVSAPPPSPAPSVTKEDLRQQELRADAILREFEARYRKSAVDLLNEMRARFQQEATEDWTRMQQQAQQNLQDAVRLLQDDLEQKLSPLRQATTSADSHLESLRHLRDEVSGHLESAKLREQAGKMQMEILGQARGQIQDLLAELSAQARQLQHLREDLNAHAASQLRQLTQSRQEVEALAHTLPDTVDRKIQQDSDAALRQMRQRTEQEISDHLRGEMDKLHASVRLAAEQNVGEYGSQIKAQLSRQYEQVMAELRGKANEVIGQCQQEMAASAVVLKQHTETRLHKAGEDLGSSVQQRVQAEMDQYRRELERSRELIRTELEEVQQRRREVSAGAEEVRHARELVESLVLNLPATVDANVRARALELLAKTREQITAETGEAAHAAAERLKSELARQTEASEATLRSRLDQLMAQAEAQVAARLERQAAQVIQRSESAAIAAATSTQATFRQQLESDFARRREEMEQVHRSAREQLQKLEATADSLLAQVDVELHSHADQIVKETVTGLQEDWRRRLQDLSRITEASVSDGLKAHLDEALQSFRQDVDKLAESSLARWQAALADMLASMPGVLRTKLEKPE